jgi:uncharacterized membrane protein YkoI
MLSVLSAVTIASGDDHEQARRLLDSGEVVSLASVIATVREQQPGRVLEVEMEREHGRWVYEIELLAPDGVVWEFDVDAASGELLERERED